MIRLFKVVHTRLVAASPHTHTHTHMHQLKVVLAAQHFLQTGAKAAAAAALVRCRTCVSNFIRQQPFDVAVRSGTHAHARVCTQCTRMRSSSRLRTCLASNSSSSCRPRKRLLWLVVFCLCARANVASRARKVKSTAPQVRLRQVKDFERFVVIVVVVCRRRSTASALKPVVWRTRVRIPLTQFRDDRWVWRVRAIFRGREWRPGNGRHDARVSSRLDSEWMCRGVSAVTTTRPDPSSHHSVRTNRIVSRNFSHDLDTGTTTSPPRHVARVKIMPMRVLPMRVLPRRSHICMRIKCARIQWPGEKRRAIATLVRGKFWQITCAAQPHSIDERSRARGSRSCRGCSAYWCMLYVCSSCTHGRHYWFRRRSRTTATTTTPPPTSQCHWVKDRSAQAKQHNGQHAAVANVAYVVMLNRA